MDEEANEFNPVIWHLAQIAAELEALRLKLKHPRPTESKVVKFKREEKKDPSDMTDEEKAAHIATSKARWFAGVGVGRKNVRGAPLPGQQGTMRSRRSKNNGDAG